MANTKTSRTLNPHQDEVLPVPQASEYLTAKLGKGWSERSLRDLINSKQLIAGIHYARTSASLAVNCSAILEWVFEQSSTT